MRRDPTRAGEERSDTAGQVSDLLLPILVLIVGTLFFILQTGGYLQGGVGIFEALENTNAAMSLAYAGP